MPGHSALDSVVQYTIAKYLFFYFNVSPAQFSGLSMPYISDDRKKGTLLKLLMKKKSCFFKYNMFTNCLFIPLFWWMMDSFLLYLLYICSVISKYSVQKNQIGQIKKNQAAYNKVTVLFPLNISWHIVVHLNVKKM